MKTIAMLVLGGVCAALVGCQTSRPIYGADVLKGLEAEPQPVVAELPPPPPLPEPPAATPAPAPAPPPAYAAAPAPAPAPAPRAAPRPRPEPVEVASAAPSASQRLHTVKSGETLQKISKTYYGTTRKWMQIYEANRGVLKSPDRIVENMKLVIPS